jgi:hypothetical protein
VSPRPGGEADKFGNRYEGAWTVRQILLILSGVAESITVEPAGDLAEGVEFVLRMNGVDEVHQLKRQNRLINTWSVDSLNSLDVWQHAKRHIDAGRRYRFVSSIPGRVPQELADFARRSSSKDDFIRNWLGNAQLREAFDDLSGSKIFGSVDAAWKVLGGFEIEWPGERGLLVDNGVMASMLLSGASGPLAAVGLGDLVLHNLGRKLDRPAVINQLTSYGLALRTFDVPEETRDRVRAVTESWVAHTEQVLLQPVIERPEVAQVASACAASSGPVLVSGAAGGGKTAVVLGAVQQTRAAGEAVLAFRLDRLRPITSTTDLGEQLGIGMSPIAALRQIAGDGPGLLLVDQLDAVSLVSGRMQDSFDAVADLFREAARFPNIHVLTCCRSFDIENDARLRGLAQAQDVTHLQIAPLSEAQLDDAVSNLGVNPATLQARERKLLRTPVHLVMFAEVARDMGTSALKSLTHLFAVYWDAKRRQVLARRPGTRFGSVMFAVADAISQLQRLSVSFDVLDADDLGADAEVLVSEHVLVKDGNQVAFFHEAFFDYVYARQWSASGRSVLQFLTNTRQELFRRSQLRQILDYLRASEPDRFLADTMEVLRSPAVRVHLKEVALAVFGAVDDPTPAEAAELVDFALTDAPCGHRVWAHVHSSSYVARFVEAGVIDAWLDGSESEQARAVNLLASDVQMVPDRTAALLAARLRSPSYPAWLRHLTRFAKLQDCRTLFDLLLDGVRAGLFDGFEHDLWLSVHDLGAKRPTWTVDLLQAFYVHRPAAFALDDSGRVADLRDRDYEAPRVAAAAAQGAPAEFVEAMLPYVLLVASLTEYERGGRPFGDRHFSHRFAIEASERDDIEDALIHGLDQALRQLVAADFAAIEPIFQTLAADKHEVAKWLLYRSLCVVPERAAEWAAALLLEGEFRLFCGYAADTMWTTRELIRTISPLVPDDTFAALEARFSDLRFSWERRPTGFSAFRLLSGLDESRLSPRGRARLGELRRKFGMDEPSAPRGIEGGSIESPINPANAAKMNDAQWLGALAKYNTERERLSDFTGGAHELSSVLKQEVLKDPARFARLALKFDVSTNPSYAYAVLTGIGEADDPAPQEVALAAVRHLANLDHEETDRWLGWALRPYLKTAPLEVVELLRDRVLRPADPSNDADASWDDEDEEHGIDNLHTAGINSRLGGLAESLAELLIFDVDGTRTAVIMPALDHLVSVESQPVLCCASRLVATVIRHDRPAAGQAFERILARAQDQLLASGYVVRLTMLLCTEDHDRFRDLVGQLGRSRFPQARRQAGALAAYAAIEWGFDEPLAALSNFASNADLRAGVAELAAHRLDVTQNRARLEVLLVPAFDDPEEVVRKEAAEVAGALRGRQLADYEELLIRLIESSAFALALPQLLFTIEHASDYADRIAIRCAQRFVEVLGKDAGDTRTGAAGNAHQVAELVVRGLAQARDAATTDALLDVLDGLLLHGAYGVERSIADFER